MQTFKIEIREFLSRIVEVEASNSEEAILKVNELYRNEEIVLDSDDYLTTEIEEYKYEGPSISFTARIDENWNCIY